MSEYYVNNYLLKIIKRQLVLKKIFPKKKRAYKEELF